MLFTRLRWAKKQISFYLNAPIRTLFCRDIQFADHLSRKSFFIWPFYPFSTNTTDFIMTHTKQDLYRNLDNNKKYNKSEKGQFSNMVYKNWEISSKKLLSTVIQGFFLHDTIMRKLSTGSALKTIFNVIYDTFHVHFMFYRVIWLAKTEMMFKLKASQFSELKKAGFYFVWMWQTCG